LNEGRVKLNADPSDQGVGKQVALEVCKHGRQLSSPVPIVLGKVVFVDMMRVKNRSALGRGQFVFLSKSFLVVHLSFGVSLELRQAVGEVVFVDLFDGVKEDNRALFEDSGRLNGLVCGN
jgi:hypothetical protein